MRTVILAFLLTITSCCFSQTRIDIDTLKFWVDVKEKIDTSRFFEVSVRTTKSFGCMNYQIHHSISTKGNNIYYRVDSLTKPFMCLTIVGPATDKINLGQITDSNFQFHLIRGMDTSHVLLKVNKQEYSLKNIGDDFIINADTTKNRIPQNYIWGFVGFSDKADTAAANEYVKKLQKAGAKFKKLRAGNYLEFIVSENHDIFPTSDHGHYHNKMYALYYRGDFQKVRQVMKTYRGMEKNGKAFSITLWDDKGNSSSTWTN